MGLAESTLSVPWLFFRGRRQGRQPLNIVCVGLCWMGYLAQKGEWQPCARTSGDCFLLAGKAFTVLEVALRSPNW